MFFRFIELKYFWKVRSLNEGGSSEFSAYRYFRTIGTATISNPLIPGENTINQPVVQAFRWRKSIDQYDGSNNKNNFINTQQKVDKKNNKIATRKNGNNNNVNTPDYVSTYFFELVSDTLNMLIDFPIRL